MPPERLVLDRDFTFGLIYRAYLDGYAKPYSQSSLQHPYSKEVLTTGADIRVQQELLPSLLLYENVEIEPFDNFTLYSFNNRSIYPKRETDQSVVLVGGAEPRYDSGAEVKRYLDLIPPEMIVDLLHDYLLLRGKVDINRDELIKTIREDIPKSYDTLWDRYFKISSELLEPKVAPALARVLRLPYKAKPLDRASKKRKAEELKDIEPRFRTYQKIVSAYTYVAQKLTHCDSMKADLSSIFLPAGPVALHKGYVEQLSSIGGDERSALVGVVYANMPWVRPRSYEEFLNLSENKQIRDFRNFFHDALENIMEGKVTLEKVGEKARRASDAARRIRSLEKVDTVTFWLSLPIGILSSLLLSPAGGFGISLALASPKLYSYIERRRYRWALVDVASRRL